MKRAVAFLAAIALALLSCGTANATLLLTGGGAGTAIGPCGYGSDPVADGCNAAPIDGAFQDTNYFTSAGVTHRMGWNVAGVDYPVGYPTSTVFKDPAVNALPGTCSYSAASKWVRCDNQSGLVFDSWDFSLHNGIQLFLLNDSNTTITNSKFAGSNYTSLSVGPIQFNSGSSGLDFEHNWVDGGCTVPGGSGPTQATLIATTGSGSGGSYTIKYNYFKNFCQQVIEADGGTWDNEFNFIDNGNISSGSHMNYQQWGSGTVNVTWGFNTSRQTTNGTAVGEGPQFYFNGTGTITANCKNNTLISVKSGGTNVMSNMIHGSAIGTGSTTLVTGTANNNWLDTAGATAALYPGSFTSWTGNGGFDLTTGSAISFP